MDANSNNEKWILNLLIDFDAIRYLREQWQIQDFPDGGRQTLDMGQILLFGRIFVKQNEY